MKGNKESEKWEDKDEFDKLLDELKNPDNFNYHGKADLIIDSNKIVRDLKKDNSRVKNTFFDSILSIMNATFLIEEEIKLSLTRLMIDKENILHYRISERARASLIHLLDLEVEEEQNYNKAPIEKLRTIKDMLDEIAAKQNVLKSHISDFNKMTENYIEKKKELFRRSAHNLIKEAEKIIENTNLSKENKDELKEALETFKEATEQREIRQAKVDKVVPDIEKFDPILKTQKSMLMEDLSQNVFQKELSKHTHPEKITALCLTNDHKELDTNYKKESKELNVKINSLVKGIHIAESKLESEVFNALDNDLKHSPRKNGP